MQVRSLQEEAKEQAPVVYYWENVEGGHGGAADNKQKAHMWTLTYSFLAQQVRRGGGWCWEKDEFERRFVEQRAILRSLS
jgi:hypothetical protein